MKRAIITILAIVFLAPFAIADTVFEKVTPDGTVTYIGQVKVRESEPISAGELAVVRKYQPSYTAPAAKMHRLELIDEEIAELQAEVDALIDQIAEKVVLRGKVEVEAKKVVLAEIE